MRAHVLMCACVLTCGCVCVPDSHDTLRTAGPYKTGRIEKIIFILTEQCLPVLTPTLPASENRSWGTNRFPSSLGMRFLNRDILVPQGTPAEAGVPAGWVHTLFEKPALEKTRSVPLKAGNRVLGAQEERSFTEAACAKIRPS